MTGSTDRRFEGASSAGNGNAVRPAGHFTGELPNQEHFLDFARWHD
jgi:hypothetical protein